jgi:hypothetical protein
MKALTAAAAARTVDARALCDASFSAGRLVGYLEALEATNHTLALTVVHDLAETFASVDDARQAVEQDAG